MREERAKVAEEEEQITALQERKKRDREEANRMALVEREVADEQMQLVRKKRRRLPDVPTLSDLAAYGKEMLAEGDTDEAMLTYSRVLAIDPTDSDALFNLAILYQDVQDEIGTAEEMLQRAVEADPQMISAWMRLARLHMLRRSERNMYGTQDEELIKQRDVSTEDCFRKALELAPARSDVLTGLGSILWHFKEDADSAQEMFSRAVQFNPLAPEPFSVYAAFLDEVKEDVSGAYVLYKRAVQLAPADNDVLWELATFLHHSAGNLTAAEQVYVALLARTPDDADVVSAYGQLLVSTNRTSDAEGLYRRALSVTPDSPDLLQQYGDLVLHEKGDRVAASRLFEAAATVDPSHVPTLITLGEMLVNEDGDWEASEAMLSRALLADPGNSLAAHGLATILLNHRNSLPLADKYFQRAVQGEPQRAEHYYAYGVFLEGHMGERRSAERLYSRALEMEPAHSGALVNLGNIIAETRNDTEAAQALYGRARELEPQSAGILNNLALMQHQTALRLHAKATKETYDTVKKLCQTSYFEAIALLEQALSLDPALVAAKNNLAIMKAHLVHEDVRAEQLFNEALELEPDNVGIHSNLALLVCSSGQLRRADETLMRALSLDPAHAPSTQNLRFIRRLMDKQRLHHLAQRHRLQYPTAQYNRNANDVRLGGAHQHGPHAQAPSFGTGGGETGATARAGGGGWLPAERGFEKGADGSERAGRERGVPAYSARSGGATGGPAAVHNTPVLRATDQPGYSWNVKDEMARATADKERALRKQKRQEEEEEARELEHEKARQVERQVATARSQAGGAASGGG